MTPVLEAREVSFAYGTSPVLDRLSLAVAPGEAVGVIGPNGCGKTTLVRLLAGVLAPRGGEVRLDGRPIATWPRRTIAQRLAVLPQDPRIDFPFTALEVVLMGRAPRHRGLALAGSADVATARAVMARLEIDRLEARTLDQLSGGERQRVLLARALVQEPAVLVLDEPTTHLDLKHQGGIYRVVDEVRRTRGAAVVSVLHDVNLAAATCDRLLLMAAGCVLREGPPRAVLTADALGEAYGVPVVVAWDEASGLPMVRPRELSQ